MKKSAIAFVESAKKITKMKNVQLLSLRVELKTSRLLNGCSNQLSYESSCSFVLYLNDFVLVFELA